MTTAMQARLEGRRLAIVKRKRLKPIEVEIGRRIRALRKSKRLTLQQFADVLDCTLQQLSRYELGQSRLAVSTLAKVCRDLDISADYFFEGL